MGEQGKKIETLEELWFAANERRAVIGNWRAYERPRPAAWLINLPGIQLLKVFRAGLYIYEKENGNG